MTDILRNNLTLSKLQSDSKRQIWYYVNFVQMNLMFKSSQRQIINNNNNKRKHQDQQQYIMTTTSRNK